MHFRQQRSVEAVDLHTSQISAVRSSTRRTSRSNAAAHICAHVFFRLKAKGRRGPKSPHPIKRFDNAWKPATIAAGCPGRIPHDFRRTAIRSAVRRGVYTARNEFTLRLEGLNGRNDFATIPSDSVESSECNAIRRCLRHTCEFATNNCAGVAARLKRVVLVELPTAFGVAAPGMVRRRLQRHADARGRPATRRPALPAGGLRCPDGNSICVVDHQVAIILHDKAGARVAAGVRGEHGS